MEKSDLYELESTNLVVKYPPQLKKEGVNASYPLQASFLYVIVGKPGSGKTYLIQQLLLDEQFYYGLFDAVIFLTPKKLDQLEQSSENWNAKFDISWVEKKITQLNNRQLDSPQMLIIIDDFINELHANRNNPQLQNILFNRRHLLKNNGTISLIITSQKYILLPTALRTCFTGLFIFKLNLEDWKQIKLYLDSQDAKKWEAIMPEILKEVDNIRPFLYINLQTDEFFRNFELIKIQK